MSSPVLLLGNGAIARGLLEAGCEVLTAYPGTPSTEVLEEFDRQRAALRVPAFTEWSVNEKVALEVALAASLTGKRAATAMKQVGLNVASDTLLSAAYTGVVGGLVVVACDDPGPHSSQTEQDTRLFALFAKVPVLEPSSPREARDMAREAFELSERHRLPVILRPTTRVCHARQPVVPGPLRQVRPRPRFTRDPARWAATPALRRVLHAQLERKLDAVRAEFEASPWNGDDPRDGAMGIVASGVAAAVARDLLRDAGRDVPLLRIGTPHPLPVGLVSRFVARHERVLVLEEPDAAIELQIPDRTRVRGRLTGDVPREGELTPEVVAGILGLSAAGGTGGAVPVAPPADPGPGPRLCPGCGHRAALFAIRKALPSAIFCGDIGCYTLGVNQRALDTCVVMGASIGLATGFWHAHRVGGGGAGSDGGREVPIVAVIGDSTFFHAGIPPLLDAVVGGARILVLVLDNATVAMTGGQPTPAAAGASIEAIVRGLGVCFVETHDPYAVEGMVEAARRARDFTKRPDGGVAVLVARRPCALLAPPTEKVPVEVDPGACDGCDHCLRFCECPGLVKDEASGKVLVDHARCTDCGMCVPMCPLGAIRPRAAPVAPVGPVGPVGPIGTGAP